jgi:hypothetical protein
MHWAPIGLHSASPVVLVPVAPEVEVSVADVPAVMVVVALSEVPVPVDVDDPATVSLSPLETPEVASEVTSETAPLAEPLSASSPASSSHFGLRSWQAQAKSAVVLNSARANEGSISVHSTTNGQAAGGLEVLVGILVASGEPRERQELDDRSEGGSRARCSRITGPGTLGTLGTFCTIVGVGEARSALVGERCHPPG